MSWTHARLYVIKTLSHTTQIEMYGSKCVIMYFCFATNMCIYTCLWSFGFGPPTSLSIKIAIKYGGCEISPVAMVHGAYRGCWWSPGSADVAAEWEADNANATDAAGNSTARLLSLLGRWGTEGPGGKLGVPQRISVGMGLQGYRIVREMTVVGGEFLPLIGLGHGRRVDCCIKKALVGFICRCSPTSKLDKLRGNL